MHHGENPRRSVGRPLTLWVLAVALSLAAPAGANAAEVTFAGSGEIIPDNGQTSSVISVSGYTGAVIEASATLEVFHPHPDDLDVALVGPTGVAIHLMSDACDGNDMAKTLQFDDDAEVFLQNESECTGALYKGSNYSGGDGAPNDPYAPPGPSTGTMNSFSFFDGTSPNGQWQLFLRDDQAADVGALISWSLTLDGLTTPTPAAAATGQRAAALKKCKKKRSKKARRKCRQRAQKLPV
jgi:subtilisin-like proprotein convertase family protein